MKPIQNSNMSNEEYYKYYGNLSEERIEDILDKESIRSNKSIAPNIQEAMGQFMPEDFMHEVQDRLHDLSKKIRGQNRDELKSIIAQMEDMLMTQFYASEYGMSELNSALKELAE